MVQNAPEAPARLAAQPFAAGGDPYKASEIMKKDEDEAIKDLRL